MKRIMMLCLALLAGGAVSAKAQTSVGVRIGFGAPGFAGFVTVGQPWYWYGGQRVYYVRRYVYGQPRYFYDSRFVPEGWRSHDRAFFERRDWDRGMHRGQDHDRSRDQDRGRDHDDRGRHRGHDGRDR